MMDAQCRNLKLKKNPFSFALEYFNKDKAASTSIFISQRHVFSQNCELREFKAWYPTKVFSKRSNNLENRLTPNWCGLRNLRPKVFLSIYCGVPEVPDNLKQYKINESPKINILGDHNID